MATSSRKSKNISLILIYTFLYFSSRSLWSQSVLSAFIYLLKDNDPEYVGLITGIMGVTQLISSFPSGWAADKYGRQFVLRCGSIVGFVGVVTTLYACIKQRFWILATSLGLWGIYNGMTSTAIMALFADSIQEEERSSYFTKRMIVTRLGSAVGPAVAIIMFTFLGDQWRVRDCSIVMCVGQVITLPPLMLLCFMKDEKANDMKTSVASTGTSLTSDEEGDASNHIIKGTQSGHDPDECLNENYFCQEKSEGKDESGRHHSKNMKQFVTPKQHIGPLFSNAQLNDAHCNNLPISTDIILDKKSLTEPLLDLSATSNDTNINNDDENYSFLESFLSEQRCIPILIAIADVTAGFASGMSIRYFPIFFLENLDLSPVWLQSLFLCTTLFQGLILGKVAEIIGTKIGRVQAAALFKWSGILSYILLIVAYKCHFAKLLICTLFVLRTSFMNSTGALTKSVLMDHVPSNERAKWSIVESLNAFSWSGSAFIGGVLVKKEGILFNFYVTIALQTAATLPLVCLFKRVKKN